MRESHLEQVERWAKYVRENPQDWKKKHTCFINALFEKHEQVRLRLLQTEEGKEKLQKLKELRGK